MPSNLNVGVVFGCSGVPNAVASLALLEGLFCSVSAVGFWSCFVGSCWTVILVVIGELY
jgi:hypothetical protein